MEEEHDEKDRTRGRKKKKREKISEKMEEEHDEEVMTLCGRRKRKIGEIKRRKKNGRTRWAGSSATWKEEKRMKEE